MTTNLRQAPYRRGRYVRFLEAAVQVEEAHHAVRVRLGRLGETVVGRSEDGESSLDQMRLAGEAALDALRQLLKPRSSLTLRALTPVAAAGQSFVVAVVEVADEYPARTLIGVCPLSLNLIRDAALAVLDATNRVLGLT